MALTITVKELVGIVGFTQQDGCYLDFREQGEQLFIIDRSLKTLKDGNKYKVTIELIVPEQAPEVVNEDTMFK